MVVLIFFAWYFLRRVLILLVFAFFVEIRLVRFEKGGYLI